MFRIFVRFTYILQTAHSLFGHVPQTAFPKSIMTEHSRDRRPPLRFAESSSAGLRGLENVIPKKSQLAETFDDFDTYHLDKPLPPTPRRPSSLYDLLKEDIIDSYAERGPKDELLPSYFLLAAATYISDEPNEPTESSIASKDQRKPSSHLVSDSVRINKWLNATKPTTFQPVSCGGIQDHAAIELSNTLSMAQQPARTSKMADEYANEYRKVLSPAPPVSPFTFRAIEYQVEYDHPDTPISSRIVDVVDGSLLPSPLRVSVIKDQDQPPSGSSGTASSDNAHKPGRRQSFHSYARKVLHTRKASTEETERRRIMSVASTKYPHMSLQPPPPWRDRVSSMASQRRESLQQGLSHMYDTLTNISIVPSKLKPSLNLQKRTTIPRDMRSPAIPITPYQHLGTKAWEASPKSPKPKSAKKKHFSLPSKIDSPTKWYKLSNKGSDKTSAGEREAEKRREELRKKIVVIGAAEHFPDGRVSYPF